MQSQNTFERTAFVTDRALEFFTESELTTQIGYGKRLWGVTLAKELVDNALDACESASIAPQIAVHLEADALTVSDNGPGLKPEIVEHSLDYHIRVSDKKYYVSPSRGQLGNALKCIWPAAFVANGERGLVEVTACNLHHRIEVSLDRIAQKPRIKHTSKPSVKKGTSVKVHWRGIACLPMQYQGSEFYRSATVADAIPRLVADFAALNPHVSFTVRTPDGERLLPASDPGWRKWLVSQPSSAHWYRPQDMQALIAAYINQGKRVTLRDFVGQFDGLSGTQYRKRVLDEAALSATTLAQLARKGDVDLLSVEHLLNAMRRAARPVKPQRLGVIGEEHLRAALMVRGVTARGFRYKKSFGTDEEGLPFVIEIAFGIVEHGMRQLILGLNHSPVFKVPSGPMADALANCRVQNFDPVVLLIHQGRPRFEFTDHGKGAIAT